MNTNLLQNFAKASRLRLLEDVKNRFLYWGLDKDGNVKKVKVYPKKSKAMNLAFDITPAKYVTALITEKGVCEASSDGLKKLFKNL